MLDPKLLLDEAEAVAANLGRRGFVLDVATYRTLEDKRKAAQVEAERDPIGVEEYARLTVAAERGSLAQGVAEMRLPSGAPMRIDRVWMERMALDAAFGEKVRAAVKEARAG